MQYPIAELYDRISIERLKIERIPGYTTDFIKEAKRYLAKLTDNQLHLCQIYYDDLYHWNGKIWDLESDIRRGKEGELGLEEVGRRALQIRDFNAKRIEAKNRIAELVGGFKETKFNHASQ